MWNESNQAHDEKDIVPSIGHEITGVTQTAEEGSILATMVGAAQSLKREPTKLIAQAKKIGSLLADDGFYRFPMGGKQIEGISIDLAQALAGEWGALAFQVHILRATPQASGGRQLHLRARVTDLKTLLAAEIDQVISTSAPPAKFGNDLEQRERWHAMQTQSASSKVVRNAILDVLPKWFTMPALEAAKIADTANATRGKSLPEARDGAMQAFDSLGITRHELETFIGQPKDMWAAPQLGQARDLYKSITSQELSVEQFRASLVKPEETAPAPSKSALGLAPKPALAVVVPTPVREPEPAKVGGDAPPPSGEQKTAGDQAPAEKPPRAKKADRPDFVEDAPAWESHLQSLEDETAVARVWNTESSKFKRAGCYDERRKQVISEIARRLPEADPERVLSVALAR